MKIFRTILSIVALTLASSRKQLQVEIEKDKSPTNNCVTFTVSQGTGCAWMCSYCANNLQTNNYYFTDGVCTYVPGVGCVGNPIAGKSYTCCSV